MVNYGKNRETQPTGKRISELLPKALSEIHAVFQERPDLVLQAWSDVIGERFAPMTQAISFIDGILKVKVNNSTLLSLLTQHEKPRLLKKLKEKFPHFTFRNIVFRMG